MLGVGAPAGGGYRAIEGLIAATGEGLRELLPVRGEETGRETYRVRGVEEEAVLHGPDHIRGFGGGVAVVGAVVAVRIIAMVIEGTTGGVIRIIGMRVIVRDIGGAGRGRVDGGAKVV